MGTSLFANLGVDIAGLVNENLGAALIDATLIKYTQGTYNSSDPAAGTQGTTTNYACKALQSEFLDGVSGDDLVRYTKGEIVIVLRSVASLKVPRTGDKITITTPTGVSRTFTIVGDVDVDPAGATATCEVEG